MASFNRVIVAGNLTRDPEMKLSGSKGTAIGSTSIAVNNRVKKGEEWVDEPCFIDVTFFGRTAEVLGEYCHKGSNVLVEGKLKMETWEKDGQRRSKHVLIGDVLQLLGGRGESDRSAAPKQQPQRTAQQAAAVGASEDIPF